MATRFAFSDAQRLSWLRLIRTDNVGPVSFRQLLNREGSAEAALAALPGLMRNAADVKIPSVAEIEDEIARLSQLGGRFVASGEPDYPELLTHIPAAPPVIALIGGQRSNMARTIAIVGARNASAAGQKIARQMAAELTDAGYTIVSGLARGIDAAAHAAALKGGTIAVLPGGADQLYPEENRGLADLILRDGGALIAEMPMGWVPRARDFPRRNRIISGLSLATLVIEAAERSGSLITARYAIEQNRDVFAVPGSPLDPRAAGCNLLIRDGAELVTSARQVVDSLSGRNAGNLPLFEPDWVPDEDQSALLPPGETERTRLLEALSYTPTPIDDLLLATGISAAQMQVLLLELDLQGRLDWSGGDMVALRP